MATLQELEAAIANLPVQVVMGALGVGLRSAQLDALRATIEQARQVDGVLTTSEEESLAPLRQALADALNAVQVKRDARTQRIAALQAHWDEQRNQSQGTVNVPVWSELEAQLRGE